MSRNNILYEYESGMEASVSSMAEEEDIEKTDKHHQIKKKSNRKLPSPLLTPTTARLKKADEIPTPSSGYEGDTEGPSNDEK
ncbi:hypothetical protein G6F56_010835 [Rhizopus delemar]|uniref:Uncharacterized protein n=1 Tax=Rhizopus stolonifer TaxID=4846 RepID=A0A367J315_RHIST|nr:hypothetical protein G6F56_010835 [Rhizopus delemar]RCH84344.1 hypothetical protein CU098_009097 [Rhizopus stolonifer]